MTLENLTEVICQQIDDRYKALPIKSRSPYTLHQSISQDPINVPEIDQELAPVKGYKVYTLKSWSEPIPFCVSLILIGPNQATAAHDHICDCGLICLQGHIEHQHFEDKQEEPLTQSAVDFLKPGNGCYFRSTEPNIHRLANPDSKNIACSLHIYSYDCDKHSSSVKTCYDSRLDRSLSCP
ncbi:MAG: hypothetical protein AB8C84_12230 [Oligoflexales bacterium]